MHTRSNATGATPHVLRLCRVGAGKTLPLDDTCYGPGEADRERAGLAACLHDLGRDPTAFPQRRPYGLVPEADMRAMDARDLSMLRFDDSRIEGYWTVDHQDGLAVPRPNPNPWHGMEEFLDRLCAVESCTPKMLFMGPSHCRLCGCLNGTTEFYDPRPNGKHGWRWPEGLRHYVEAHHVEPGVAFQNYIAWRAIHGDKKGDGMSKSITPS